MKLFKYLITTVICQIGFITVSFSQENVAGKDQYVFKESSVIIGTDFPDPTACYYWEPKELLEDNTLPNPIAKVSKTTTFTVTVTGRDFSYSKTGSMTVYKVKIESIAGLETYTCKEKQLMLKAILTGNVSLPKEYIINWDGDAQFGKQDNLSIEASFIQPSWKSEVRATISGSNDTTKASTLVVGFQVHLLKDTMCDGYPADLQIEPLPVGVPLNYLDCFEDFNLNYELVSQSFGNPLGSTSLIFTPLNDKLESRIEKGIWYSTQSGHCNPYSSYTITATGTIDGKTVKAEKPATFTVDAFRCINGNVLIANYFSGEPDITASVNEKGKWVALVKSGTFRRDVRASLPNLTVNQNSQFYKMTLDEEEYHAKQINGTVPCKCIENLFDANKIINYVNQGTFTGNTELEAIAKARDFFSSYKIQVLFEDSAIFQAANCKVEYEAKTAVGANYISSFKCTYPNCPNNEVCP